ncbi:hypothetical protein [Puia dinghuensis]|uniref:Uncharacterized protein n=1 Tax=Puia dinghuensis TaxID=1792502 RepID=A0A8J2XN79_9BACT|nr:hypothetical protein [Puia dinghuensis]GGA82756.1 hypothetical protein GCM10011511_02220 [Puia dinghuensis]
MVRRKPVSRLYFKNPDVDTVYWVDAGKSQDKELSYQTREDAEVNIRLVLRFPNLINPDNHSFSFVTLNKII